MRPSTLLLLMAAAASTQAPAEIINFSYTFNLGAVLTGSLSGNVSGDTITDISDVSLYVDGHAFDDNGTLAIYSWSNTSNAWIPGNAQLSFSGLQNNFLFLNGSPDGGWTNELFAITGSASTLPLAPPEIGWEDVNFPVDGNIGTADFPPNSSWQVAVVPLPASGWLLLGGLVQLGILGYRRRSRLI